MRAIAKYSNTINYNIKTTLDNSGIAKLQAEISKTQNELREMASMNLIGPVQEKEALGQIKKLETAIRQAYNPKIGMLDTRKLTASLESQKTTIGKIGEAFGKAGTQGTAAFTSLIGQISKVNTNLNTVSKTTDKIANTIGNTFRWGIISSGFQGMMNSLHNAVQYLGDLDTSLTNIRLVSDYSKQDMREFAQYANKAAAALGNSTVAYTDAALIYAQQGYGLSDQKALADTTLKVANVTGQETSAVSDQITAVMNGYHLSVSQASEAFDKLAMVANVSAADVEELAKAEARVASTANTLGISQDQLQGQIATIISVTREAPENVGNALKTIYARLGDLEMGKTLEDGVSLGKLSGLLDRIGVKVLNQDGEMRAMGDIMEELMANWSSYDRGTQQSLASTLAGKYQMNRFMTLMSNEKMYSEYKNAAANSEGTLDTMQEKYMDSLKGKAEALKATFEGLATSLFDQDDFGDVLTGLTDALNLMTDFTKAIGGGSAALTAFGAIGTKVFSEQIGRGISNAISNFTAVRDKNENAKATAEFLKSKGLTEVAAKTTGGKELVEYTSRMTSMQKSMSSEQLEQYNKSIDDTTAAVLQFSKAEETLKRKVEATNQAYKLAADMENVISKNEKGEYDFGDFKGSMQLDPDAFAVDVNRLVKTEDYQKLLFTISDLGVKTSWLGDHAREVGAAFRSSAEVSEEAWVGLNDDLLRVNKTIDKLNSADSQLTINLAQDMTKLKVNLEDAITNGTPEQIEKATEALQLKIKEAREVLVQIQKGIYQNTEDINKDTDRYEKAKAALDQQSADNKYSEEKVTSQQRVANIVNMTGAIGQLAFTWQSFQALGSLWSNDDLELGEKILQTVMNLAMSLPMAFQGIVDFGTGFTNIVKAKQAAMTASTAANLAEAESETVNTAATEANTVAQAANAGSSKEAAAANAAQTVGIAAETAVTEGATVATVSFGRALWATIWPIGLVVTALAGLGVGIKALVDLYNKDSIAADKAKESATQLTEAYSSAKEELNTLDSSISSYEKAKQNLSELQEGTEEWTNALKGTNTQVLELLKNYPELAKYTKRNENGLLEISSTGLDEFKTAQEQQLNKLEQASVLADINANEAKNTAAETSLRRKINWVDQDQITAASMNGTAAIPQVLSVKQLDQIYSLMKKDGEQSVFDGEKLAQVFGTDVTDPMVQAIVEQGSKIVQAYEDRSSNELANQLRVEEVMKSRLEKDGHWNPNDEKANEILSILASDASKGGTSYKKAEEKVSKLSIQDLADEYATANGLTVKSTDWLGNSAEFRNAEGETVSFDKETMQTFLISSEAMSSAADKWNTVAENLNKIAAGKFNTTMEGEGTSLMDKWQAGGALDISELSGRQVGRLKDQVVNEDGSDRTLSVKELFGDMDSTEADEWAVNKGFKDAQSYAESFSNGVREAIQKKEAFNDFLDNNAPVEQQYYQTTESFATSEEYQDQKDYILDNVKSVEELDKAYEKNFLMQQDYAQGLRDLGANYKDLSKETSRVKDAQENYYKKVVKGEGSIKEQEEATEELTAAQEDLQDALVVKEWEKAADACDEYVDTLNDTEKGSEEYQKAAQHVADTLSDLTGIEVDTQWVSDNQALLTDWKNGVEGAASAVRVAIGQASDGYSSYVTNLGSTVQQMNAALGSLHFDINGDADFAPILSQLAAVRNDTDLTAEEALNLANMLSSIGTTHLEFEQNGELVQLDIQGLIARLQDGDTDALAELNEAISAFKGDATVTGTVPAAGVPQMAPASSGGGGSGSGGSSGGGGGGGGGGSSYTPKKKDPLEEKVDRYERVNAQLDGIGNDFEKIADEQDRLAGFDLIDNMNKQIGLLVRQIALQKEKLEIQKEEAAELRNQLSQDYGITFDAEGYIANYKQIHQSLINKEQSLINQYNATGDEAGQTALEEQIEEQQKAREKFEEAYKRYDELFAGDMKETTKALEDLEDQIEDLRIKAFQTQVEALDNIKDIQEKWIEFNNVFSGRRSDDPFREMQESVAKLSKYYDVATTSAEKYYDTVIARLEEQKKQEGVSKNQIKFLNEQIRLAKEAQKAAGNGTMELMGTGYLDMALTNLTQINEQIKQFKETGASTIFGKDSADLYSTAKDVFDQAADQVLNLEELIEDLQDQIIDGIDDIADRMDERLDQYEAITDELEHQRDIIELLHGEESYDEINKVLSAQQANYQSQIQQNQRLLALYKDMQSTMIKDTPEWKALQEKIVDAQQNINDLVTDSLKSLQEQYENTVNKIQKAWEKDLFGDDLDWAAQQWELINRNADQYLDSTNAAYNIQKLQSKYLELLDGSNDLHVQQQITEQMNEQLGYLREKDKLSEYDVAYANAQLEILQKRIALEEAQNNKSQMKLRRDSQGNYSYVYTANQDDIASKQNDLLDAQNNAYNLSKENMSQVQDDALKAMQDAQSAINDIWNNANLTLEEKKKRTETILDGLREYIQGCSEQLNTSEKNIINDFINMADMLTTENGDRLKEVYDQIIAGNKDAFDQIDTRWDTSITNMLENMEHFSDSMDTMFGDLVSNAEDFNSRTDEIADSVDQDFDKIGDAIDKTTEKTEELNKETEEFFKQLQDDSGIIKGHEAALQEYQAKIQDVTNEMKAYKNQVNDLQNSLTEKELENATLNNQIADLESKLNQIQNSGSGGSGIGNGGSAGQGTDEMAWGIAKNIWTYGWQGGWGNDPTRSSKLTDAYGADFASYVQGIINQYAYSGSLTDYGSDKYSSYNLIGYDTGGYTGQWGDTGKLALLHQKELVLNASDTENILAAVNGVRDMVTQLKTGVLSNFINQINSSGASPMKNETQDIQQTVHITADFPAVNSSAEIEAALLSLNDRAIQYAFKR